MFFNVENKNYGLHIHKIVTFRKLYMFRWLCGQHTVIVAEISGRLLKSGKFSNFIIYKFTASKFPKNS